MRPIPKQSSGFSRFADDLEPALRVMVGPERALRLGLSEEVSWIQCLLNIGYENYMFLINL